MYVSTLYKETRLFDLNLKVLSKKHQHKHCVLCSPDSWVNKHDTGSLVGRSTSKMSTQNSLRVGRWVSTWRASSSTTRSTSGDPVGCLCTRAKVSAAARRRGDGAAWSNAWTFTPQVSLPSRQIKSLRRRSRRPNTWAWLLEGQVSFHPGNRHILAYLKTCCLTTALWRLNVVTQLVV